MTTVIATNSFRLSNQDESEASNPTGNLDSQTGERIFDLLHSLTRSQKVTIIAVMHDLAIAGKTDKTFKMQDGKLTEQ